MKQSIEGQIKELQPEIRDVIERFDNKIKAFLIFREIQKGAKSREQLVKKLDLPRTSIYDCIKIFKTNEIVSYYKIKSGMKGTPSKYFFIADGEMDKYVFPNIEKRIMLQNIPRDRLRKFYLKKYSIKFFIPADTNVLIDQLMNLTFKPNDFRFFVKIDGSKGN